MNIWEKCVAFHEHECGGLTIGYKAALYAIKLLELEEETKVKNHCCISTQEEAANPYVLYYALVLKE